jgi:hypothetical protein
MTPIARRRHQNDLDTARTEAGVSGIMTLTAREGIRADE